MTGILLIRKIHFTDETTQCVGTAVAIKNVIKHEEPPKYALNHLQTTVIEVKASSYALTFA